MRCLFGERNTEINRSSLPNRDINSEFMYIQKIRNCIHCNGLNEIFNTRGMVHFEPLMLNPRKR